MKSTTKKIPQEHPITYFIPIFAFFKRLIMINNDRIYKSKEYLYQEWVINKKSQRQIAEENKVSMFSIEKFIKLNGLTGARHKSLLHIESEKFNFNNPYYCHFLGFIAADGCLISNSPSIYIVISDSDSSLLEMYKVKHYVNKEGRYLCSIRIHSNTVYEHCKQIGMMPSTKTFDIKFPSFEYSDFFFKYYLRGFMDGDGNIRSNRCLRVLIASEKFAISMVDFLNNRFKFETLVKVKKQKKIVSETETKYYPLIEFGGNRGFEFLQWLYSENSHIGLQRKVLKALNK